MKKIILSLITVVVFVIIVFVMGGRTSNAPGQQATATPTPTPSPVSKKTSANYSVQITAQGLSTKELNVKVGDTITFVNLDAMLHWPASGPHPTHQICQGFEPKQALKQNEQFSYTFRQAVTCPIHDHINAQNQNFNGKIFVSE